MEFSGIVPTIILVNGSYNICFVEDFVYCTRYILFYYGKILLILQKHVMWKVIVRGEYIEIKMHAFNVHFSIHINHSRCLLYDKKKWRQHDRFIVEKNY